MLGPKYKEKTGTSSILKKKNLVKNTDNYAIIVASK